MLTMDGLPPIVRICRGEQGELMGPDAAVVECKMHCGKGHPH